MRYIQQMFRFVATCAALAITQTALAQQPRLLAETAFEGPAEPVGGSPALVSTKVVPPAPPHSLTERWLDLTTLSHGERFRSAIETGGSHDFQNAQSRSLIEGKFKIDPAANYEIGFRASSGRYFNWAYSNYTGLGFDQRVSDSRHNPFTPAELLEIEYAGILDPVGVAFLKTGLNSNGWEFYMRELYLSATPVKPVTVEFGSFGIERGYSTEITTFDEDGYLSGERLRLHDPKHLFFDEVSFTNAYFGDFGVANLFQRGSSLENFNYRQVAAKKKLNERVAFSGEYTWQTGTSTLREGVVIGTKPSKIIDSARLELYQRVNSVTFAGAAVSPVGPIPSLTVNGASGFAIAVEKKAGRLSGDFGFASVDNDYSVYFNNRFVHSVGFSLNGDTYGVGKRVFLHTSVRITPAVTAFGFYTHQVGTDSFITLNQEGVNGGLNFNLKALINTKKAVF